MRDQSGSPGATWKSAFQAGVRTLKWRPRDATSSGEHSLDSARRGGNTQMTDSLAAVVVGFGEDLELRRIPIPELEPVAYSCGSMPRRCAVRTCISGTARSLAPKNVPYIPGHETCGTIVEIGGERTDMLGVPLQVGDRIIAAYPFCGHCYYCTVARQPVLCPNVVAYGRIRCDRPPYLLGGCAEHHYFPPGCDIVRVPDGVPSALAASAACALRTIMHALRRSAASAATRLCWCKEPAPSVYAAAVARDRGARKVLVIGAPVSRLEVATMFGADDVLDLDTHPDPADRLAWARDHTDGRGPDVVIRVRHVGGHSGGARACPRTGGRFVSIGASVGTITLPAGSSP